jgi:hypothetical protein
VGVKKYLFSQGVEHPYKGVKNTLRTIKVASKFVLTNHYFLYQKHTNLMTKTSRYLILELTKRQTSSAFFICFDFFAKFAIIIGTGKVVNMAK